MGSYLSEFFTALWESILSISDIRDAILLIIAIIILFSPSLIPLFKRNWSTKLMWSKLKLFWSKNPYRWVAILLVVIILSFNAQYGIYQDKQQQVEELQNKVSSLQEEHKPYLTINPDIISESIYSPEDIVGFEIQYKITNTGDRPAYQTRTRGIAAPLTDPNNITSYGEKYQINPIIAGNDYKITQQYAGKYSVQGTHGLVLLYVQLKYSNQPKGGIWYEDEFWYLLTIELDSDKTYLGFVDPQWEELYKPYIDKKFPNK